MKHPNIFYFFLRFNTFSCYQSSIFFGFWLEKDYCFLFFTTFALRRGKGQGARGRGMRGEKKGQGAWGKGQEEGA